MATKRYVDETGTAEVWTKVKEYAQADAFEVYATLTAAGWSNNTQTISVAVVTASNMLLVAPRDVTDKSAADEAELNITARTAGKLTFSCESTPTSAISIKITVLN